MTMLAPRYGSIAYDLYRRLGSDRYGGWLEAFGDDLGLMCERVETEVSGIFEERQCEDKKHIAVLEKQVTELEDQIEQLNKKIQQLTAPSRIVALSKVRL